MSIIQTIKTVLRVAVLYSSTRELTAEESAKKIIVALSLQETTPSKAIQCVSNLTGIKTLYSPPAQEASLKLELSAMTAEDAFCHIAALATLDVSYTADGMNFTKMK